MSVLKVNSKRHYVPAHRGNERLFPLSRSFLAGLLCAGLLWSPAANAAKPSAARQTNEDKGSLAGAYLAGVLAVNLHDTAAAALYSQRLLQLDPRNSCLLYTSPSPRDRTRSRMPSSA